MKYLFAIIAVILAICAGATYLSYPTVGSPVPIIYWVTDPNPVRGWQVLRFHEWLITHHYSKTFHLKTLAEVRAFKQKHWSLGLEEAIIAENPGAQKIFPNAVPALRVAEHTMHTKGQGDKNTQWRGEKTIPKLTKADLPMTVHVPELELRIDTGNRATTKELIQGVAGVGSDLMDEQGGGSIRYFHAMGLTADVTKAAKRLGFDPSHTWRSIRPEITIPNANGQRRQYAFPCNVTVSLLWVNKQTFAKFHQPLPPQEWSIDTFTKRGKAFVKAANKPGQRQKYFFANTVDALTLARSLGVSVFNETMTRCTLNNPHYVKALSLLFKWTYQDHLLPTSAQSSAFSTASGYGGSTFALFEQGNYAMVLSGRWALIGFRKDNQDRLAAGQKPLQLTAVQEPNGGFPNGISDTRAAIVYAGGHHQNLADLFLAYLASKRYNLSVVRSADGLPPNPKFTKVKEFQNPPDHPGEGDVSEKFANAERTIGIGRAYSPFVLDFTVQRVMSNAVGAVLNERLTPKQAAAHAARDLNTDIQRDIQSNPKHRALYEKLIKQQRKIDRLRQAGKKVPWKLIDNPFLKRYYQFKGWAE